jgi:pSer/pThr/pTyr-binding forkhead associated (FHA) protein
VIRIGRSSNNHVVLYSAVVSRHHIELCQIGDRWELTNLGSNGTYLDGTKVTKIQVQNGAIIRLARSGPRIKIHLDSYVPSTEAENQKLNNWMDSDSPEQETTQEEITQSLSRQVE